MCPGQQHVLDARYVPLLTYATRQLRWVEVKGLCGGCQAGEAAQKLPGSCRHLPYKAHRRQARQLIGVGEVGRLLGDVSGAGRQVWQALRSCSAKRE